jgi:Fic family protein
MPLYIWESSIWPRFQWQTDALIGPLSAARKRQGRFLRIMEELGFDEGLRAHALTLEEDAIQTAAIEGEKLDREGVRSSIALQLGLPDAGLRPADRATDGLVQVLLDATHNVSQPLNKERLCSWHFALFPSGRSGLHPITAGEWRSTPMSMTKTSCAAAWREIEDMVKKDMLRPLPGKGRASAYEIAWEPK